MQEGGINLSLVFSEMISNVPIWTVGFFILKFWLKKREDADLQVQITMRSMRNQLNRIELILAESGLQDLKQNIESLKESRTKHEMQIQSLFRVVDKVHTVKRASDP